jgi:hypothetical protein
VGTELSSEIIGISSKISNLTTPYHPWWQKMNIAGAITAQNKVINFPSSVGIAREL